MSSTRLLIVAAACLALLCTVGLASAQDTNPESLYNIQPRQLTIADCGGCHKAHFGWLQSNGGRHQTVACWDCHEQFHVYNPTKKNYAAIMPKCSQCHDYPHGNDPAVGYDKCLGCHQNPHQPVASLPKPATLYPRCKICHSDIAQMLTDKPSKHTERKCSDCHSQVHGRIPKCFECHENHSPLMANLQTPDCLQCHPVHTPLEISYPATQPKELCAGCHDDIYNTLMASNTKHTALTCAKCHPTHGEIPRCQRCHGEAPHNPELHKKFPECLTCHVNPHDLQI